MAVNPLVSFLGNVLLDKVIGKSADTTGVPELANVRCVARLAGKDGAVVLILGRRESGKTVCAHRLAEIIGKPTYCISPEQKPPLWIRELKLQQLETEPPPNSTLILDDLPAYMSSRSYNNPLIQFVESIIPVVRHKRKLTLIFNSQASSLSDKHVMDSDMVFLKKPNILFSALERPPVVTLYREAMQHLSKMPDDISNRYAYLFAQDWKGLVRVDMPRKGYHA